MRELERKVWFVEEKQRLRRFLDSRDGSFTVVREILWSPETKGIPLASGRVFDQPGSVRGEDGRVVLFPELPRQGLYLEVIQGDSSWRLEKGNQHCDSNQYHRANNLR
jgi:hypothetical protein